MTVRGVMALWIGMFIGIVAMGQLILFEGLQEGYALLVIIGLLLMGLGSWDNMVHHGRERSSAIWSHIELAPPQEISLDPNNKLYQPMEDTIKAIQALFMAWREANPAGWGTDFIDETLGLALVVALQRLNIKGGQR